MNDIEILEKFLDNTDIYFDNDINECAITAKVAGIIQNLIKENKELKENLKIATAMLTKGTYPEQNKGDNDFSKQFIPKSKVKEKIEELEMQKENVINEIDFKAFYRFTDLKNIEICILQELLEEGE